MSEVPERFVRLQSMLSSKQLSRDIGLARPLTGGRWAAVLIAISNTANPDIIFTERAHGLRNHPGQLAFPGGGAEDLDDGPSATALREANEEVGLDPASVTVLGALPAAAVPISKYDVVGVVGYWDGQKDLTAVDAGEVASVHRWTIDELSDPANRVTSLHPSGHLGPAWRFGDFFLWGFTGFLVDHVLRIGGWERPWDRERLVEVPKRFRSDRAQVAQDQK